MSQQPAVIPVEPGYFHRLGIAAPPEAAFVDWFERVLGAVRVDSGMRQVHGIPFGSSESPVSHESGATTEMVWLGNLPICVFAAVDGDGQLGSFVAKYGAGLHSVAWTIDDIWKTETLLRRAEIRITGVDLPGRHFFMHPADTAGLLIELTDTEFDNDPRDNPAALPATPATSVVQGGKSAWITMVVDDPTKSVEVLSSILDSSIAEGLPREEGTEAIDLRVHDVVIRFLRRAAGESGRDTLHSWCISVPDLDQTCARLESAGIGIESRSGSLAWTHAADTLGMRFQWVQEDALSR